MLYCPNFFWNVLQVWMTGKDVYLQMTWSWPDKTWNILCSYCLQWNTSQNKFRNHYFLFLFAFSILSQLFLIWGCIIFSITTVLFSVQNKWKETEHSRFVVFFLLYRNPIEPWPPNRGTYWTVTSVYRATPMGFIVFVSSCRSGTQHHIMVRGVTFPSHAWSIRPITMHWIAGQSEYTLLFGTMSFVKIDTFQKGMA